MNNFTTNEDRRCSIQWPLLTLSDVLLCGEGGPCVASVFNGEAYLGVMMTLYSQFNDLLLSLVLLVLIDVYRTRWLFGEKDGIQINFDR
jgi:hypothetical protein